MAINFDTAGALREGYTYDEIASHLSQQAGFNLEGALKEGYSAQEIVEHLTAPTEAAAIPTEEVADPEQAMLAGAGAAPVRPATMDDVAHQTGLGLRALIKGGAIPFTMLGDALNSGINFAFGTKLGMTSDLVDKLADAVAVPRNEKERVVGAAAETVASLLSTGGTAAAANWLVSKGNIAANKALQVVQEFGKNLTEQAVVGATTAATGQAVGEYTDSPAAGLAAGIVTAFAGGKTANRIKAGKQAPKQASELYAEADAGYEAAKQAGVKIKTYGGGVGTITNNIKKEMDDATLLLEGEGMKSIKTLLNGFTTKINTYRNNNQAIPIEDIEKLRRDAGNLIGSAGGNVAQRKAGYIIRGAVDEWMAAVNPKQLQNPDIKGVKELIQARGKFRTASRVNILEDIIEDAREAVELDKNKVLSKELQKGFEKLLKNENKLRANFKANEIQEIKDIVKGGAALNALVNTTGVFAGLAGRMAALTSAFSGNVAALAAIPISKGLQSTMQGISGMQKESAARALSAKVAEGRLPPEPSKGVVGGLFGIEAIKQPSMDVYYGDEQVNNFLRERGLLQ